jgi:hypothetical protein
MISTAGPFTPAAIESVRAEKMNAAAQAATKRRYMDVSPLV